ncbi:hypothetical protein RUM43_002715 [Polyplax serrata]|uniref:Uncharacterized protein n=1 Tax=Polyplax serrata TaxID=468196 RepID=A0AAN8RW34_POLSC
MLNYIKSEPFLKTLPNDNSFSSSGQKGWGGESIFEGNPPVSRAQFLSFDAKQQDEFMRRTENTFGTLFFQSTSQMLKRHKYNLVKTWRISEEVKEW